MKRTLIVLFALALSASGARAAEIFEKVGTFDGQFLTIPSVKIPGASSGVSAK